MSDKLIKLELGIGYNLFTTLNDVCEFIALDTDMTEIVNAVALDNLSKCEHPLRMVTIKSDMSAECECGVIVKPNIYTK